MVVNKIIAVEGLDKTGKSTFCAAFESIFAGMYGINTNALKKFSFPNATTPIGKMIRDELATTNPDPTIVSTPNFLAEMSHFWMQELYNIHYSNTTTSTTNNINKVVTPPSQINYIFDRYFISTLAYQAFYNDSRADLEFIKTSLRTNAFIKMPTDLIVFDLPNDKIIERTLADQEAGINDINDTTDITILNARREAYKDAITFLKGMGIQIHWFEDVSVYSTDDLVKVLMGKIFG